MSITVTASFEIKIIPSRPISGLVIDSTEVNALAQASVEEIQKSLESNADEIADNVSDATGWCVNGSSFDNGDVSGIISGDTINVFFPVDFKIDFDTSSDDEDENNLEVVVSVEKTIEGIERYLNDTFEERDPTSFGNTNNSLSVLETRLSGIMSMDVQATVNFQCKPENTPQPKR